MQLRADTDALPIGDKCAFLDQLGEARLFERQIVLAGRQSIENVVARIVGLDQAGQLRGRIAGDDGGSRNDGSGLIQDRSFNRALAGAYALIVNSVLISGYLLLLRTRG